MNLYIFLLSSFGFVFFVWLTHYTLKIRRDWKQLCVINPFEEAFHHEFTIRNNMLVAVAALATVGMFVLLSVSIYRIISIS